MRQSSRRHLSNEDGERHSRDQNIYAGSNEEKGAKSSTSQPKGIGLLGLWGGHLTDGERWSGIFGRCGHGGGSKWANRPVLDTTTG